MAACRCWSAASPSWPCRAPSHTGVWRAGLSRSSLRLQAHGPCIRRSGAPIQTQSPIIARQGHAVVLILMVGATRRSWPASFLVGPAKSAGIACFNACGTAGGFVGPYLIGEGG